MMFTAWAMHWLIWNLKSKINFFSDNNIDKGVMTLVDENQQHELISQLDIFEGNKASGGSAANTLIAVSSMGGSSYYSCKVADDDLGHFYLDDLKSRRC